MADLNTLLVKFLADLVAGAVGATQALASLAVGTAPKATAGAIRLGSTDAINYRTANNVNNRALVSTDGSDTVILGNASVATYLDGTTMTMRNAFVSYNGITLAGFGVPVIVASARVTAQSAANASIATFTVGASDASFQVSANLNCTASSGLATTLTCTYTDEANAARSMIFPIAPVSGTFAAAGAINATGAWHTPEMRIRCKAATVITILTSAGTFTSVTYTAEGQIKQVA